MKNLLELKRFQIKGSRVNQIYPLTEHSGAFRVYIGGRSFDVIASVDEGGGEAWEHVSVCRPHSDKLPTWEEMCAIKDMFFEPEEECVQFHNHRPKLLAHLAACGWRTLHEIALQGGNLQWQ